MALSFTWKTREGLLQVAEGVRVDVSTSRAPSVPGWYADYLRDRRLAGVGLKFSNAGFTLDNVPDVALGDSRVESPADRAVRVVRQRRLAAERRETERQEADEPGAFDDDDWGASMDAPSIEGPLQRDRRLQDERLNLEDTTLVESKVPRPLRRERLLKVHVGRTPKERLHPEDDAFAWRFDE